MGSPMENQQQMEEQAMYSLEIHMEDYQTEGIRRTQWII